MGPFLNTAISFTSFFPTQILQIFADTRTLIYIHHDKWLFETVLESKKSWLFIYYIEKRGEIFFFLTIIYVILRIKLDNGLYSITRSCMIRQ